MCGYNPEYTRNKVQFQRHSLHHNRPEESMSDAPVSRGSPVRRRRDGDTWSSSSSTWRPRVQAEGPTVYSVVLREKQKSPVSVCPRQSPAFTFREPDVTAEELQLKFTLNIGKVASETLGCGGERRCRRKAGSFPVFSESLLGFSHTHNSLIERGFLTGGLEENGHRKATVTQTTAL